MTNFNKNDGFQVKVLAEEDQLLMGGILDGIKIFIKFEKIYIFFHI